MRDLLGRFSFVTFYLALLAIMGYCGLILIELAFKEIAK